MFNKKTTAVEVAFENGENMSGELVEVLVTRKIKCDPQETQLDTQHKNAKEFKKGDIVKLSSFLVDHYLANKCVTKDFVKG